jgi:RNA polymerase sigma factor (TIGR02999 family)
MAPGTVECANARLTGEHLQKRARNRRSSGFSGDARRKMSAVNNARNCGYSVTQGGYGAAALRRLARAYMARERQGHTLQVTAVVNEAFLRLPSARRLHRQDRAHFLGISARLMRRVLVDYARARGYRKRGGGAQQVTLDEALVVSKEPTVRLLDLDRALKVLAAADPRKSRVIELRFFGGLNVEETAEVLHVSVDTVKRDWRVAKLWLLREMEGRAR